MRRVLVVCILVASVSGPAAASHGTGIATDIHFPSPVQVGLGEPNLGIRARLTTGAAVPLPGRELTFTWPGVGASQRVCVGTTDTDGWAVCEEYDTQPFLGIGTPWPTELIMLIATFAGDATYHDSAETTLLVGTG